MQLSAQHHPRPVTSKLHARRPDRIQHVCRASGLCVQQQESAPSPVQRRTILSGTLPCLLALQGLRPPAADAIGFKKELKKRKIPEDQYRPIGDGVKVYDLTSGSGTEVANGQKVTVHFDSIYKGIDVASSRSARLLGGNRVVAEVSSISSIEAHFRPDFLKTDRALLGYHKALRGCMMYVAWIYSPKNRPSSAYLRHLPPFEFTAGTKVSNSAKKINDSANGLFTGAGGPKPPKALSNAVIGMKVGGKRSVLVPPEMGYGSEGLQEIPPNSPFELQIEVLNLR